MLRVRDPGEGSRWRSQWEGRGERAQRATGQRCANEWKGGSGGNRSDGLHPPAHRGDHQPLAAAVTRPDVWHSAVPQSAYENNSRESPALRLLPATRDRAVRWRSVHSAGLCRPSVDVRAALFLPDMRANSPGCRRDAGANGPFPVKSGRGALWRRKLERDVRDDQRRCLA